MIFPSPSNPSCVGVSPGKKNTRSRLIKYGWRYPAGERADGERAALTLFAAISTGASFTPVHEAEAGWIISSHVISRCNVRCRVFEIVCSGAFFSGVARLLVSYRRAYRRLSFLLSFCYRYRTSFGFCKPGNNQKYLSLQWKIVCSC